MITHPMIPAVVYLGSGFTLNIDRRRLGDHLFIRVEIYDDDVCRSAMSVELPLPPRSPAAPDIDLGEPALVRRVS